MEIPAVIDKVKSGIIQFTFNTSVGEKISSGSGFISHGKLISNNHVFFDNKNQPLTGTRLHLRFGDFDPMSSNINEYSYEDFMSNLSVGSDRDNFDFAVFNPPKGLDISERYQFDLTNHETVKEGEQILIMGFPFGRKYLTSHLGYISSIYELNGTNKLQLDASVNPGNSGGPLIDLKTLSVVGIVTRNITGLDDQFDELLRSFKINADVIKRITGVSMSGVDVGSVLAVSQNQMSELAKSIKRNASVGIGVAYSTDLLKNELDNL